MASTSESRPKPKPVAALHCALRRVVRHYHAGFPEGYPADRRETLVGGFLAMDLRASGVLSINAITDMISALEWYREEMVAQSHAPPAPASVGPVADGSASVHAGDPAQVVLA